MAGGGGKWVGMRKQGHVFWHSIGNRLFSGILSSPIEEGRKEGQKELKESNSLTFHYKPRDPHLAGGGTTRGTQRKIVLPNVKHQNQEQKSYPSYP